MNGNALLLLDNVSENKKNSTENCVIVIFWSTSNFKLSGSTMIFIILVFFILSKLTSKDKVILTNHLP